MQHGPAAAFAMRVDQFPDRSIDAHLRQRLHDELALPRTIGRLGPMLHGAAAADSEMRADRRDAFRGGRLHPQQMPPVGMAGQPFGFDRLAGQGVGDKSRAFRRVGDSIAAMANPKNGQAFEHVRPRAAGNQLSI